MTRNITETLESTNPKNDLTLTLGDLVQIWVSNLSHSTDVVGELEKAIDDIQIYTLDGERYTLDDLNDMPREEVLSLDFTQETLQAVLDSGVLFRSG